MVKSDKIDDLVSDWDQALAKVKEKTDDSDGRGATQDFIIATMRENKHHTESDVGPMVCQALLWLVVNGPVGEKILPFMREGGPNMAVHQEISVVKGKTYNFRTSVDEKTAASMQDR